MTTTDDSVHETSTASAARGGSEVAKLMRLEQVRLYYHYLPLSQVVTVLNAIVFVAVQSLVMRSPMLLGWLAAVCLVALIRIFGSAAFRRAAPQPGQMARWRGYAIAGAAASGIVWGAAAIVLFPPDNVAHQVFVAFMLGGMVAGSVTTLTPLFPAFLLFTVFALVPVILRFLLEHEIIHFAMSWMILVFLVAVIMIARRSHLGMADMMKLRFENTALVGELLAAQENLRRSHEDLERRVGERTAELSRTNAELQRFAYVASHDLQEPLRNATNFALLLEERYRERLDADGKEFLQYIVSGVTQMRQLVDDLLFHSRVGSPQLARTDCEALLARVLSNFNASIAESGAVVTHDTLPEVWADGSQLAQVFVNLISNAIKFRGPRPLRVHVGVELRGAEWVFSVRDNGIGIDPQYFEKVFEMFERLFSQARYPGTGIGLAICKKIVEGHNGRIWVEPGDDGGTRFCFTLPRA